MTIEAQPPATVAGPTEAELAAMTRQERGMALNAVALARAQETYRLSLLNPPAKSPKPLRYGRIRNNWQNAYD